MNKRIHQGTRFCFQNDDHKVVYVQCARTAADHPMKSHVDGLTDGTKLTSHAFYSTGGADDGLKNTEVNPYQFL